MAQVLGISLVCLALIDIFLTVLYPRSGKGWLSVPLSKALWILFRAIAALPIGSPFKKAQFLSFCGPVLLIIVVLVWVLLLLYGFALMIWPALGTDIQSNSGNTPTDFVAAIYYSGYSLTTLGFGDLVPQSDYYRLLTIVESALGFSIFTLTITYLVAVYGALMQRNIFALSLHHKTTKTANTAELLTRMAITGDISFIQQSLDQISLNSLMLLESHHAYPVLHYFRFSEVYYSFPRIALLVMDTATLLRSALSETRYRALMQSTTALELGDGGQHLLIEISKTFLPKWSFAGQRQSDAQLRAWYYHAIDQLQQAGIETTPDYDQGVEKYITLRRQWEPYVMAIANYMSYDWREIAPAEYQTYLRSPSLDLY